MGLITTYFIAQNYLLCKSCSFRKTPPNGHVLGNEIQNVDNTLPNRITPVLPALSMVERSGVEGIVTSIWKVGFEG